MLGDGALEFPAEYRCDATVEQDGKFMGLSQNSFVVNDPPYGGTCSIEPSAGASSPAGVHTCTGTSR